MSGDEAAYWQTRLEYLRTQFDALARWMIRAGLAGALYTDHYDAELSRLAWLIEKTKEKLGMTRTMYDSTDPDLIPQDAQIVCYYPHAWGSDMTRHHSALQVRIDNRGDHADDCHALDVENGAASVQIASQWIQSWHKLHPSGLHAANGWIRKPVIYCSESLLPSLRETCKGQDYDTWAANWSTGLTPVAGCFAKQYTDHGPNGENYDMSVVYDDTWGKEQDPAPAPAPQPATQPNPYQAVLIGGYDTQTPEAYHVHSDDRGVTWHR